MNVRHTEAETAALIARFAEESETAAPAAPRRAPVSGFEAPESGYRVTVAGHTADVSASGYGAAVLAALPVLAETLPDVSGYVFLWRYRVTGSDGRTLEGSDREMREALEAARIAAR